MPTGRPLLPIACAYGTLSHDLEVFHFFSAGFGHLAFLSSFLSVVSKNPSPCQVCNRLVLIFAYLIFSDCMDCLAKHGCPTCAVLNLHVCFPCWMFPADRTSPVRFLCHLKRVREQLYGPLAVVLKSRWGLGNGIEPRGVWPAASVVNFLQSSFSVPWPICPI